MHQDAKCQCKVIGFLQERQGLEEPRLYVPGWMADIPCSGAALPEAFSEFGVLDHLWQNCTRFKSSNYRLLRVHINIPGISSSASREIIFF